MSELDDELQPISADLINEFGKTVQYKSVTPGVGYNTATSKPNQSSVGIPVSLKVLPEDVGGRTNFNGVVISGGDMILTQAVLGTVKPKAGDIYTIDGIDYVVPENGIKLTYSGEKACLYQVLARVG